MNSNEQKIVVGVRKRPLTATEQRRSDSDIIQTGENTLSLFEPKEKLDLTPYTQEHRFQFDHVYSDSSSNKQIFESDVAQLIHFGLRGGKTTCFAYGQTGSGKTFTMFGDKGVRGLVQLGIEELYSLKTRDMVIFVSFYEIYCGKIFDIINGRKQICLREDGEGSIQTVGLIETPVSSSAEMIQLIATASKSRVTSSTKGNYESSRSHAVIQLKVRSKNMEGKISFIDLAGNEKAATTSDADKQTRVDGAEINKSLLALKECIRAMDQDLKHTPFRGSKLTMVLRDSFEGNSKTLMIACVSPNRNCCEQTLNTLRYADRMKEIPVAQKDDRKAAPRVANKDRNASQIMKPPLKRSVSTTVAKKLTILNQKNEKLTDPSKMLSKQTSEGFDIAENLNPSKISRQISAKVKETARPRAPTFSGEPQSTSTLFKRPLKPIIPVNIPEPVIESKPTFPLFNNLFKKPAELCSAQELRNIHYEIINHMIGSEEELLEKHKHTVNISKRSIQDEIAMVNIQETNALNSMPSNRELYCKKMDGILCDQLEQLLILQSSVGRFSEGLKEERVFAEQFIRNLEPSPADSEP